MNRIVSSAIILLLSCGAYAQTAGANLGSNQQSGKAKVVFYYGKPAPIRGCLEQAAIQIDGATVHQIFQRHVWQTEVTPGVHVFSDDSHRDKGETATLAPGQTYYYELGWGRVFGLATCSNSFIKFHGMNAGEIQKANALLGKPGSDETLLTPAVAPEVAKPVTVKLSVVSIPEAADIEIDGNFVGSTPSAIELPPGEHTVAVSKKNYQTWQRKIKLTAGDIRLNAELEADVRKQ